VRVSTPVRRLLPLVLCALGLWALAAGALRVGFLNDDYLFLEQARTTPLLRSLTHADALGNYYRPLSRQIYFAILAGLNASPAVFHALNFLIELCALALLLDLLTALLPFEAALAGALYFALIPLQRVAWLWISCSQDLLALAFALGSFALYRRDRRLPAAVLLLAALASKESALPLPLAMAAWDVLIARRRPAEALRRAAPMAVLALGWSVIALTVSLRGAGARLLHFGPEFFLAAWVHEAQSLIGLDDPAGILGSLAAHGPDAIPWFLISLAVFFLAPLKDPPATPGPVAARRTAGFAVIWLIAMGFVVGPLAATWSSYFYMSSAVGGALLVGLGCRRLGRWAWPGLAAALLWWHAGGTGGQAFATADRPWGWTSHLTSFYFERAAALTDTLSRELRELEPRPPHGARFFFVTLPPWAGFQMGSGALVRELYRDPSLASFFYSQYSESTADDRPSTFLRWDGRRLRPLYARGEAVEFQVGSDLLLLDRPAGASFAFRRGLAAGENTADLLYWLGWSELWQGRRAAAEDAWLRLGARDDPARFDAELAEAGRALGAGDTLRARRALAVAIRSGIGRPRPHAMLGDLLLPLQPKYAMMELSVAAWLDPEDLESRRLLVRALSRARLDAAALRHLEEIERGDAAWRRDPELRAIDHELRGNAAAASGAAD
jgi:hypothetical protein